ncbi:hypothetical protein F4680DRAFT_468476 [Xylaria scruposa]|nr:hypothetical protein F4680DRAFT_468476 [Xylaria scruposa]
MSKATLPSRGTLSTDQRPKPTPLAWCWSGNSTAHACTDKDLFKEYTRFTSKILYWSLNGYYELSVQGIGTIELGIKNRPGVSDETPQRILRLVDVLHVPDLPINVIAAQPDIDDWISPRINSYIYDNDKNLVSYFPVSPNRLFGEPGDSVRHLLETSEQSAMSLIEPYVSLDRLSGSMAEPSNYPVKRRIALSEFPSFEVDRQIISWKEVDQLRWRTYKCMRQDNAMPTHDSTTTNIEDPRKTLKRMRRASNTRNGAPPNSTEPGASRTAQHAHNSAKKVKFDRNAGRRKSGAPFSLDSDDEDRGVPLAEENRIRAIERYVKHMKEKYPNIDKFFEARQLDMYKAGDWDKAHAIMQSCISTPDDKPKNQVPAPSVNGVMKPSMNGVTEPSVNGVMEPSVNGVRKPSGAPWLAEKETMDQGSESSEEHEYVGLVSQVCAEMEEMNAHRVRRLRL